MYRGMQGSLMEGRWRWWWAAGSNCQPGSDIMLVEPIAMYN